MLAANPKILLISKPAIGDVLLMTPLMHAIRARCPGAVIDLLVSQGQEDIVEGNRDLDTIMTANPRAGFADVLSLAHKLWRRYDIAIGNAVDDRMHLYLWLFGRKRVSIITRKSAPWKRWITFANYFEDEKGTHAMLRNNALGTLLGFEACHTVYPPRIGRNRSRSSILDNIKDSGQRYAVLHLDARLPYKRWTNSGWRDVTQDLAESGLKIYLTGGGGNSEVEYLESAMVNMPDGAVNLSGLLRFAEVSELLAGSSIYIGVDTVSSHIAAALGIPTVVLFGPESPYRWGPWPAGHVAESSPWESSGSQRLGNVCIVQSATDCDTCGPGNCSRRRDRHAACTLMAGIKSDQVVEAVQFFLSEAAKR